MFRAVSSVRDGLRAALINEVDLLPNIMPVELSVRTLKNISRFRKVVYVHIKTPWPFDDRDMVRGSLDIARELADHVTCAGVPRPGSRHA